VVIPEHQSSINPNLPVRLLMAEWRLEDTLVVEGAVHTLRGQRAANRLM
jgi:hypothetical protein